jgi:hypothetical protein
MNRGQQLTMLGAIGLIIGALLPWASISSIFGKISKAGYEGDGVITGAIGLLLLIGSLLNKGKSGKRYSIASAVFAIGAGIIGISDLMNINSAVADISSDSLVLASTGPGVYITIIGAVLALVGGLQKMPDEAEPSAEISGA